MKIKEVSISEYKSVFIAEDGTAWAHGWVNAVGGKLVQYKGGHKFISAVGGLYNTLLLKENGDVYINNPNSQDLKFLQYDNSGVAFRAIAVESKLSKYYAVRDDGTIWIQSGTSWTKLSNQPVVKFKSIVKGVQLVALAEDGTVYTLADNSPNWVKKTLPGKVERIMTNGNGTYIAIINGLPVGWGQSRYLTGITGTISGYKELSLDWGITAPLIDIGLGDNALHFITSDNKLFGFGDNAQGEVGVGWELVNRKEIYKGTQYTWNWINAMQPTYQSVAFVTKPTHISPEKKFKRVYAGGTYSYYRFAQDIDGNPYSWGRNKAVVLANGIANANESAYPNALDVLSPTQVDPFAYTIPLFDGSLYQFIPGVINAGADQLIDQDNIVLKGSATPAGSKTFLYTIVDYDWVQLSGPKCMMDQSGDGSLSVDNMSNGVYVFQLTATDNNGATMTDTVSITVDIKNSLPIVNAFYDQFVIGNSSLLIGKAKDVDGNVVSTLWEKVSGPDGDHIVEPSSIVTEVSFTVAGNYIYKLTATDDKGASSSKEVKVEVGIWGEDDYILLRKK